MPSVRQSLWRKIFKRYVLSLLLLPIGLSAVSPPLLSQGTTDGAMLGTVLDPLGRRVIGAVIMLTNERSGARTVLHTDRRGEFLTAHLAPDLYLVTTSAPGFSSSAANVVIELGGTAVVEQRLAVARVAEQVTVSADTYAQAVTAGVISSLDLAELPLNGRRWQSLALLLPEVTPDISEPDTGLLSFRGLPPTQNSSQIDGVAADQSYSATPSGSGADATGGIDDETGTASLRSFSQGSDQGRHPGAAYTFTEAAVHEFRVTGQNDSALNGHAAGGIINTVSRSGGNLLHGNVFFLLRESAWAATNPYAIATAFQDGVATSSKVKPHDLRQQFGGSLGGPVLHDRLFFFYAFDAQRRGFPAISSPENPDFYALTPTQLALLANRGVRADAVTAALTYIDSLTGPVLRRADQTVNFAKLDWQAGPTQRLSVEENRARATAPAGLRTAAVVSRGRASFGDNIVRVDSLLGRWIWATSPRFSNELRLAYGRDLHREQAQTPLAQEPAISPGGLAPEVDIGPEGLIFGTPTSVSQGPAPEEHRLQAVEVATLSLGRHLIQLGADYSHVDDQVELLPNAAGLFHYDSGATNGYDGGLVDWITDYTFGVNSYPNGACPSITASVHYSCFRSFSQSFGGSVTQFNTGEWAAFLQDDWRVRQRLTLGLGLRYEYEYLPLPQQPNAALDATFGRVGATSIFPEDRNNFGPRVSAAWSPLGEKHGTLRLAYGVYYGRVPGATIRSTLTETATGSGVSRIRILPTTITGCPQVAHQGFGYPCAFVSAPPTGVAATTSVTVFDRHFRTPMLQQASFTIEHPIGRSGIASASYLLTLNRQLPNAVDINIQPATQTKSFLLQGGTGAPGVRDGESFQLPLYTDRVSTRFGPVTDILSNANGTYNALLLEAQQHSHNGLDLRASWLWSKALDFGQNTGAVPPVNGQFDPFNVRYDKALSALNNPHRLVVSAAWSPEIHTELRPVLHAALGWTLALIATESSGRPYSYDVFGGTRLSGGRESINGSGGLVYLPTVGRNVLRLPDTANFDARLSRTIRLRESAQLRAFAEVFNVANHVNISSVSQRAFLVGTSANGVTPLIFQNAAAVSAEGSNALPFGTRTEASAGSLQERQLQLGLRLNF